MTKRYASLFLGGSIESQKKDAAQKQPYKILLVDDDAGILSALRRVFQRENYELLLARNANEALMLLSEKEVHLVISDFMMPGMNGSELLVEVRRRWPETIRIMLTGHANTQAVMGSIQDGAVYRFILKPWNDDDLRLTIALALEQYALIQRNKRLEKENESQSRDLSALSKLGVTNRNHLAMLLHKRELLSADQVEQLHKELQTAKNSVISQIIGRKWLSSEKVYQLLKNEFKFEEIDLREFQADASVLSLIPKSICTRQYVLPLRVAEKKLRVAVADPMDQGLFEELGFLTGLTIYPLLCNYEQLHAKLTELFGTQTQSFQDLATAVGSSDPYEGIEIVLDDDETETLEEIVDGSDEPPAIRLGNAIILEALRLGASDIHIHPRTKHVIVRYRIDGVLQDKIQIPSTLLTSLVSRIKVLAELDITERRRPQDGRITVKTPMRIVDLRISTLPTINGEKVVMRVLERQSAAQSLEDLGLSESNLKRLLHVVSKPQGIILATGPTGSGKTTTLFALLQHEATPEKNYVTIEDPVEFHVDLAGQVPVRERIGLNFASVLRAILRQDPDVILLGEIRDNETAEVAFHAALTGHMVFSTLHTNSAAATVARLLDLGLKPYMLATALEAIIAQRLVRKICVHCKTEVWPDEDRLSMLGKEFTKPELKFFKGLGCAHCTQGYKGRIGIHEVLTMNDSVRKAILDGVGVTQLQVIAKSEGMRTLLDDAKEKMHLGLTTVDEILRTLGPQDWAE